MVLARRGILIGALLVVFVGSVIPVTIPSAAGEDKISHFLIYFLLCFLFYWNGFSLVLSLVFSICYGVFLEIVQFFLPFRTFSFLDILANSLGAGLFCLMRFSKK